MAARTRAHRPARPKAGSVAEAGAGDTSLLIRPDAAANNGQDGSFVFPDSLAGNRDRLLRTYAAYLKSTLFTTPSTGVSGANFVSVCDLWPKLVPSVQGAFLTLTARMQGSKLSDGSSMLGHVKKLYRIAGGEKATATDPGSCGGGESNRLIMSMMRLSTTRSFWRIRIKAAAFRRISPTSKSAQAAFGGTRTISAARMLRSTSATRRTTADRAGSFNTSKSVTSSVAKAPLGRTDLATLVDPSALEIDQDYDCVHNSNAICSYTTYGNSCAPGPSMTGTALYSANYANLEPGWLPSACGSE